MGSMSTFQAKDVVASLEEDEVMRKQTNFVFSRNEFMSIIQKWICQDLLFHILLVTRRRMDETWVGSLSFES